MNKGLRGREDLEDLVAIGAAEAIAGGEIQRVCSYQRRVGLRGFRAHSNEGAADAERVGNKGRLSLTRKHNGMGDRVEGECSDIYN